MRSPPKAVNTPTRRTKKNKSFFAYLYGEKKSLKREIIEILGFGNKECI